MRRTLSAYLLLAPQVAALLLIIVLPFCYMGYLMFLRTDFIATKWVGLDNIIKLATDRVYWKVMVNTAVYTVIIVSVSVAGAVIVVLLCMDFGKRLQDYIRFVSMVPSMAAGLIISTVWKWIFHPTAGVANWLLGVVGIAPVWWFGGRWTGIVAISIVIIYGGSAHVVLLMASALTLSRDLIESALVDGAKPPQIRRYIMLPHLAPTIALIGTLAMIGVSQMWETVMMMSNGGPDYGTATLMFDIYETAFLKSQFGYGAAKTVVLIVLVLAMALLKRKVETWGK